MKKGWRITLWVLGAAAGVVLLLIVVTVSNVSMGPNPHAMRDATRASLNAIRIELDFFRQDHGRFPTEGEGLDILTQPSGNPLPLDPWGNSFRYRVINGKPAVDSAGPDMAFDTDDDIGK